MILSTRGSSKWAFLGLASILLCSHSASAAMVLEVDISGAQTDADFPGSPGNTVLTRSLPANAQILGVEYTIDFTANAPSLRNEFIISLNASDYSQFWDWKPAPDLDSSGNFVGSGSFGQPGNPSGGPFSIRNDGILIVTFYEEFPADTGVSPDALVNAGTLRISYVPEPSGPMLLALAVGAHVWNRRRR